MEIDNLLSKAQKAQVRKSMQDWVWSEVQLEARDQARALAVQWMKENKDNFAKEVNAELDRNIKRLVKTLMSDLNERMRGY